jgi:hypothetical protein
MSKKRNNNNSQRGVPKVLPISQEVAKYQEALDLFRRHPSIPTYFFLLDQAWAVGARFESLEQELDHLIDVDDDQFYGAYGSKYFIKNRKDLDWLLEYRGRLTGVLAVCKVLWGFLQRVETHDLYGFENCLIGESEYGYWIDKKNGESEKNIGEATPKAPPIEDDHLSGIRDAVVDAVRSQEDSNKTLSDLARNHGRLMVPWAAWVKDYLPDRPCLASGIEDFSDYLSSYYSAGEAPTHAKAGYELNPTRLDTENALALSRIATFLIFGRLFKKHVYAGGAFDRELFLAERIEHLSSRETLEDGVSQAEYIFAISNLLMILAKLDINSVRDGFVTERELRREFLADVVAENGDLACLCLLPDSGFAQMVKMINPFEGDRPECYDLTAALRVADYGAPTFWDADLFDEMYSEAFRGLQPEVEDHLRSLVEKASMGWVVPIQSAKDIRWIYTDFWTDKRIVKKISDSLFQSDKLESGHCKLIFEELDGANPEIADWYIDYHPILFSRTFSHNFEFVQFSDRQWLDFCHALIDAGQVRHACTVLALNITIVGVNRYFNFEFQKSIDVKSLMGLLDRLSGYNSFAMVRQAITDFFDIAEDVPSIYKGSLKDFISKPTGEIISIKKNVENDLDKIKKHLFEAGFNITRLSKQAAEDFAKGYYLIQDTSLVTHNLAAVEAASHNFFLAVEGELRSRAPEIDTRLADELIALGVHIDWKRGDGKSKGYAAFRGLGSLCHMIDLFPKLTLHAQEKLGRFKALVNHSNISAFKSSMREFTGIRNDAMHGVDRGKKAGERLSRVQELLFGAGSIVRILCETR